MNDDACNWLEELRDGLQHELDVEVAAYGEVGGTTHTQGVQKTIIRIDAALDVLFCYREETLYGAILNDKLIVNSIHRSRDFAVKYMSKTKEDWHVVPLLVFIKKEEK